MSQTRPNVFPTSSKKESEETVPEVSKEILNETEYIKKSAEFAEQFFSDGIQDVLKAENPSVEPEGYAKALADMQKRAAENIKLRNQKLAENAKQAEKNQDHFEEVMNRSANRPEAKVVNEPKILRAEIKSPINKLNLAKINMSSKESYISNLSQPQMDTAYDVLPLPSEGKLYGTRKSTVKVAFMTAADENILTSPNLLASGEFLEILINRKLLDTNIRYRDLHVGDRNAIMLWLRATSYGEMYPITILDENDVPFDTEINLNDLKTKKLGAEPDEDGHFEFLLPVSKKVVKFRLLNVGDLEDIQAMMDDDIKNEIPVNSKNTYTLLRQIISVDGIGDSGFIGNFATSMRIGDSRALREYIESIESGVDLQLSVKTPGGGSVKTFFPLNISFFWPDLSI